jgi:DNA repair exonuclease SbcCD ATPase subunit
MHSRLNALKHQIAKDKGRLEEAESVLNAKRMAFDKCERELGNVSQAAFLLKQAATETQNELRYQLSDLPSMALQSVMDDGYELDVAFPTRRGRTECEISFLRDGQTFDPLSEVGGGGVDLAAFALRLTMWAIQLPQSRNVLILDEPFRFLSAELRGRVRDLLHKLSSEMGIQIIMVTHDPALIPAGAKVFRVSKRGGVSHVVFD